MEFTYILYMVEAIALTVMLGVIAIPLARKYKAQQSIREEGPKSHRLKAGTPTMGGLFVCLSMVFIVIWNRLADSSVLWLLFLTLGHGLLKLLQVHRILYFTYECHFKQTILQISRTTYKKLHAAN